MIGNDLVAPLQRDRSHVLDAPEGLLAGVRSGARVERKLATVLFTDLQGSMELLSSIELDEWWSVISDLVELMCDRVYEFGGWIADFTGDGVFAVFEDDHADYGHGQRACDAALALRDALNVRTHQLRRERGLGLSVRIGLNSGEVVTGAIGGRHARYYTASGYTVSLAKRIEGLATPGHVHVSEHTAALLHHSQLRDLGAFSVKGASAPVRVFELTGRNSGQLRIGLERTAGASRA